MSTFLNHKVKSQKWLSGGSEAKASTKGTARQVKAEVAFVGSEGTDTGCRWMLCREPRGVLNGWSVTANIQRCPVNSAASFQPSNKQAVCVRV